MDFVNEKAKEESEEEEDEESEPEEKPKKSAAKRKSTTKKGPTSKKKKGKSDDDDGDDDDAESGSDDESRPRRGSAKKKSQKRKGGGGGGTVGYLKSYKLSPALATLVGEESMPRHAVVKKVWQIVKEQNLYDPKNKQFAICNPELLKVMGVKRFRTFGMMKYLKDHFIEE